VVYARELYAHGDSPALPIPARAVAATVYRNRCM
jgi:hypothetical protein